MGGMGVHAGENAATAGRLYAAWGGVFRRSSPARSSPRTVRFARAVGVLRSGGVVAYPTEAVYGLGCDPWCEAALDRILAIKRRRIAKGLILIGSGPAHLAPFVRPDWMEWVERRLGWPPRPCERPVTWLVPARARIPAAVTGGGVGSAVRVAVRVTAHPVAAALCRGFGGAIVSTSANAASAPSARTALDARLRLGRGLDLVVPGLVGAHSRPSTIRDAATGRTLRG